MLVGADVPAGGALSVVCDTALHHRHFAKMKGRISKAGRGRDCNLQALIATAGIAGLSDSEKLASTGTSSKGSANSKSGAHISELDCTLITEL